MCNRDSKFWTFLHRAEALYFLVFVVAGGLATTLIAVCRGNASPQDIVNQSNARVLEKLEGLEQSIAHTPTLTPVVIRRGPDSQTIEQLVEQRVAEYEREQARLRVRLLAEQQRIQASERSQREWKLENDKRIAQQQRELAEKRAREAEEKLKQERAQAEQLRSILADQALEKKRREQYAKDYYARKRQEQYARESAIARARKSRIINVRPEPKKKPTVRRTIQIGDLIQRARVH